MLDSTLVPRLRAADSFASIAAAVIDELRAMPGVAGVAVEAHVGDEPVLWFGTEPFAPADARRYVDGEHRNDRLLARLRESRAPVAQATQWIAALDGCGELVGAIRIVVGAPGDWSTVLQHAAMLASVRLAQIGGFDAEPTTLTARQHEVAVLVSRGCTNQEIAEMLAISANAVKKHVSRALELLDVSNRTELASVAIRWSGAPAQRLSPAIRVVRADKSASCAGGSRAA